MSRLIALWPSYFHAHAHRLTPSIVIGALVGVIMPLVAAWVYPTLTFTMPTARSEWTRLQELPFVLCEIMVIFWASKKGMELRHFAALTSRDCRVAGAAFLIGLWGSTLFVSKALPTSVMISMSTVLHILFAFSVYHLVNRHENAEEKITYALSLGLIVLAILTAFRFLLTPYLLQLDPRTIDWASALPGFISVRHFGSWTGAVTAVLAAAITIRRDDSPLDRLDFFFFLAMGMTIWSGTRAAMLAIGVAGAIMIFSRWQLPSLRMFGRLSLLTGAGATAAWLLVPYNHYAFMLFEYWDSNLIHNTDAMSSGRISLWHGTYEQWLRAPWFGWGSGSTFWEVFELNWTHTQPHNFILQFLISWGIVGAAGAFWLLGRATIAAHRRVLAAPQMWPFMAGLYCLLVMALLEGMLHYPRFIMLIMLFYALIFRLTEREPQKV